MHRSRITKFIKEYRLELLALVSALLGIYLLVERVSLRRILREWLTQLSISLGAFARSVAGTVTSYLTSLTISDLVGWVLLLLVAIFIVWRVRYRFANAEAWQANQCPKCGNKLERIHRRSYDRLLARTLLPHARRYRCTNPKCDWTGLRRGKHDRTRRSRSQDESQRTPW